MPLVKRLPYRGLIAALFILLTVASLSAAQSPISDVPSADMIVIDGARTPEQIPEHMAWSMGFRTLAMLKKNDQTDLLEALDLSPGEAVLVYAAAEALEGQRDKVCEERGRQVLEKTKGLAEADVMVAVRKATLECRWDTLNAKDALIAKLGPKAAASLTAWMNQWRKYTKAYVRKSELWFHNQPR